MSLGQRGGDFNIPCAPQWTFLIQFWISTWVSKFCWVIYWFIFISTQPLIQLWTFYFNVSIRGFAKRAKVTNNYEICRKFDISRFRQKNLCEVCHTLLYFKSGQNSKNNEPRYWAKPKFVTYILLDNSLHQSRAGGFHNSPSFQQGTVWKLKLAAT